MFSICAKGRQRCALSQANRLSFPQILDHALTPKPLSRLRLRLIGGGCGRGEQTLSHSEGDESEPEQGERASKASG